MQFWAISQTYSRNIFILFDVLVSCYDVHVFNSYNYFYSYSLSGEQLFQKGENPTTGYQTTTCFPRYSPLSGFISIKSWSRWTQMVPECVWKHFKVRCVSSDTLFQTNLFIARPQRSVFHLAMTVQHYARRSRDIEFTNFVI